MLRLFKSNLTEEEFGKRYFEDLKNKVPGLKFVSLKGLELKTSLDGQEATRHFLDNCFAEYKNDPKDLKEIIDRYTNASKELFIPKEKVREERIVPIVKDYRFLNKTAKLKSDFEKEFLYEKYNEELYIFYAEDRETTITYLKKEDIAHIGKSLEDIKSKAIENLGELASSIERHGEIGDYMLTMGGNYESSLILLDIWKKDNFPVDGDIVIGVPARDLIFVTGSNDKENIQRIKDKVKEVNDMGDHVVSNKLFVLTENKFKILE